MKSTGPSGGEIMKKNSKSTICSLTILLSAGCFLMACNGQKTVPSTTSEEPSGTPVYEVVPVEKESVVIPDNPVAAEGVIGGIPYTLEGSDEDGPVPERGWYTMTSEDKNACLVMISSGEQNTGGYSVEITDIRCNEVEGVPEPGSLVITVKETAPDETDTVTEAITHPVCYIGFTVIPDDLVIQTADGNRLDFKGEWGTEIEAEDGYIAVFEQGAGEIIEKTYVYELSNGKYRYVNVTATTVKYGGPKWREIAKGEGIVDTMEDIVNVSEKHGSNQFVMIPSNPGRPYSIEEYLSYQESGKNESK